MKFFGKNEFVVKPLFQDTVPSSANCLDFGYDVPYTIPDSVSGKINPNNNDSLVLIVMKFEDQKKTQEQTIQVTRVLKEFSKDNFSVVYVVDSILNDASSNDKVSVWSAQSEQLKILHSCIFLLDMYKNGALIDAKNRIAGQYDLTDREDTDRLILELKILLKKYLHDKEGTL